MRDEGSPNCEIAVTSHADVEPRALDVPAREGVQVSRSRRRSGLPDTRHHQLHGAIRRSEAGKRLPASPGGTRIRRQRALARQAAEVAVDTA